MAAREQGGAQRRKENAPDAPARRETEHVRHFQKVSVGGADTLQQICIQYRKDHQKGDKRRKPPRRETQKRDHDERRDRHRLDRRDVGPQQCFDKRHGGGERREDPREREREQKAERNAREGKAERCPEIRRNNELTEPPRDSDGRYEQQIVPERHGARLPDAKRESRGEKSRRGAVGVEFFRALTHRTRSPRPAARRRRRRG